MIGKITGTLVEVAPPMGLVETVSGVAYELFLPISLLSAQLPKEVSLYTHLQVRDDAHILFGFETRIHRQFFHMLLSVAGVGPKTAYAVITHAKPEEIREAVSQNDPAFFTRVPGLGKKTALKIILELSQKLDESFDLSILAPNKEDTLVIDALISLGFSRREAVEMYRTIPPELSVEEKITYGLRRSGNQ